MLRRRHHEKAQTSAAEGKKMRQSGKVDLSQEALIAAPKADS
jgi:hypothetical protein